MASYMKQVGPDRYEGSTDGPQQDCPKRRPEVQEAMDRMERANTYLREAVDAIGMKIQPVLSPAPVASSGSCEQSSGYCDLAKAINAQAEQTETVARSLMAMVDRIEL